MKELSMTVQSERTYLPAAGRDSFLPFYDLMTKLMGADQARRGLLDRAQIRPNYRILEIGCGNWQLTHSTKTTLSADRCRWTRSRLESARSNKSQGSARGASWQSSFGANVGTSGGLNLWFDLK
jgi:hypothetical protein